LLIAPAKPLAQIGRKEREKGGEGKRRGREREKGRERESV